MRKKLVNAIIDLSNDELEIGDVIEIASEDIEELIDRLINIAEWYRDNEN